ncbi:hypothetical protein ACFX2I_019768 [Malus domestica]
MKVAEEEIGTLWRIDGRREGFEFVVCCGSLAVKLFVHSVLTDVSRFHLKERQAPFGECVSFRCQFAMAVVELGFPEETTRFSVRGEGKSEEEVTDNEQAENWFSFDIHPSHMWWELGGYEDGTLSRKSEMPKKIKRRPMT